MGLISRVSSRTYSIYKMIRQNPSIQMNNFQRMLNQMKPKIEEVEEDHEMDAITEDTVEPESISERIIGLTDFVPESVVTGVKSTGVLTANSVKWSFTSSKKFVWYAVSLFILTQLPGELIMSRNLLIKEKNKSTQTIGTGGGSRGRSRRDANFG